MSEVAPLCLVFGKVLGGVGVGRGEWRRGEGVVKGGGSVKGGEGVGGSGEWGREVEGDE